MKIANQAFALTSLIIIQGCCSRDAFADLRSKDREITIVEGKGDKYIISWSDWDNAERSSIPIMVSSIYGTIELNSLQYHIIIGEDKCITKENPKANRLTGYVSYGTNPLTIWKLYCNNSIKYKMVLELNQLENLCGTQAISADKSLIIESAQQVDSAEPSTKAVPPSTPTGSAR